MAQLVRYDEARRALAECSSIDDAADIRNKAAALEAYARQRKDVEMEKWVAEIKLRAVMRIGELSADLPTSPGARTDIQPADMDVDRFETKKDALRKAGLSEKQAERAERLAGNSEEVEAYIAKKSAQGKPVKYTEVLAAVEANKREELNRAELHRSATCDFPVGLHVGDFREKSATLEDECAELVFTDPPYDRDSIPLFGEAAAVAARILKPGGSFLAYCGQIQLPEALAECARHLRYWWCAAALDPGSQQRMNRYGVICQWKPLLWFVKGTRGDVQNFVIDVVEGPRDKSAHVWQQAEEEAAYYIEKLTSQNGLVVDFFAGGGTTLAAARRLGRQSIGFEIDALHAARAAERLRAA